jgi:hypothetical protein
MPTAVIHRRRPGEREEARLALAPELLEAIRQYGTCTIADAIERCGVRLRNEGFTRPGLACFTAGAPRAIGYAATYRVKSAAPARNRRVPSRARGPVGPRRTPFPLPASRSSRIWNRSRWARWPVRDLPGVNSMGVPVFGRSAAVSHAYTHLPEGGAAEEDTEKTIAKV